MLGFGAVRLSFKGDEASQLHWTGIHIADWVFTTAVPFFSCLSPDQVIHLKDHSDKSLICNCLKKFDVTIFAQQLLFNSPKDRVRNFSGQIKHIWKSNDVESGLKRLFNDPSVSIANYSSDTSEIPFIDGCYFLAIKLNIIDILKIEDAIQLLIAVSLPISFIEQGLPITIVSTPFGIKSLFNSWSSGIISNVLEYKSSLLVADIRLAPSCEGSPIYRIQKSQFEDVVGLILSPLITETNEYSGYSLGVPTVEIANSLWKTLSPMKDHLILDDKILDDFSLCPFSGEQFRWQTVLNETGVLECIVLISVANSWATGVIVENGLVMTSAHVVSYGDLNDSAVTIIFNGNNYVAKVVFSTSPENEIDLAVLTFNPNEKVYKSIKLSSTSPQLGENVLAIGFSIFMSAKPNVSGGIISNISKLLFSSCVVQSGMSGGALIRVDGTLLGIIECNLKADNLYPNINVSVPCTLFGPPLKTYLKDCDATVLYEEIEKKGKHFPKLLGSKL